MITPLIMLSLMTGPYVVSRLFPRSAKKANGAGNGAAATGLGLLFLFTGVGHFIATEPMSQMLPGWMPQRILLIHLSGWLECLLGFGFFIPPFRRAAGWIAISLLVAFFPLNVYAAVNHVPMGGHVGGPSYLLIRGPLQAIILLWTWWFTVRGGGKRSLEKAACEPGTQNP